METGTLGTCHCVGVSGTKWKLVHWGHVIVWGCLERHGNWYTVDMSLCGGVWNDMETGTLGTCHCVSGVLSNARCGPSDLSLMCIVSFVLCV